ncbi:tetratricopeptide repeat protein [Acidisarcina polymorpha]|nr:tetratricopeptide repeat protein [Acidisarcina polymorpha]
MHRFRNKLKYETFGWPVVFLLLGLLADAQVTPDRQVQLSQADAAFHAGYAAAQSGDLGSAKADFQQVVQLAPEIAEGHSALGSILVQLGQYSLAIPELERALSIHAEDRSAQINLALAYQQTHAYDKSVTLFRTLDRDPADLPPSALIAYAAALTAIQQPDLAVARLQKALVDAPSDASLHDALGSLEAQRQDWPAAQSQFEQAIALDANLAAAHEHLGVTLLSEQRPADAVRELTVASELSPQDIAAQVELGRALIANGDAEKAVPILQHAVQFASSLPASGSLPASAALEAKYQLALALQGTGQEQQSIPLFQQVVDAEPRNAPALTNLALALVQTGKSKEAIPLYERSLAENAKDPLVHQDLGVAYLQQSDLDDAIREFRTGVQLAPDAYELHYNLGLALKLKDDVAAAKTELELAARLNPASPDPPFTLGILNMQIGHFDEAAEQLKLAVEMRPDNGDGWAILGSVYKQQNNLPEAAKALREAVRLLPNQPGAHITLAGVLAQQGQKDEAAAERKIAADLTRGAVNRQRATFAANSGNLLLQQGKITDAIERFQDAVSSDPTYIDGHRGLADALTRSGRTTEAEAERAKIAQIEKNQP